MALRFKKNSDLLANIRKGDEDSFKKLYDTEFERIYRFVAFKIGNEIETEEIVQDIFFSFWEYARTGKPVGNITGLLYRIARNKIIDHYRRHGVRPKPISLDSQEGYELAEGHVSDKDIERELDISMEIESIQSVMVELPDDYRDVLIMRFLREMEMKEIAEAFDKTEGAVRVMIYRALKSLKKLIENNNG